jgi:hypothetical protein
MSADRAVVSTKSAISVVGLFTVLLGLLWHRECHRECYVMYISYIFARTRNTPIYRDHVTESARKIRRGVAASLTHTHTHTHTHTLVCVCVDEVLSPLYCIHTYTYILSVCVQGKCTCKPYTASTHTCESEREVKSVWNICCVDPNCSCKRLGFRVKALGVRL